jgi:hypothetical protein
VSREVGRAAKLSISLSSLNLVEIKQ